MMIFMYGAAIKGITSRSLSILKLKTLIPDYLNNTF